MLLGLRTVGSKPGVAAVERHKVAAVCSSRDQAWLSAAGQVIRCLWGKMWAHFGYNRRRQF